MELHHLRGFVTVAELGHLTRAADKLHLSQPALSAQIKALEQDLGLDLFERRPGGMALTPAGRRLIGDAQRLLEAAQALRNEARALRGDVSGVARVGTVSDPDFIRVGALTSLAVERHPHLEIQLHHEVSGEAFDKVRDGLLDASYYYGERTDPAVVAVPLREIAYRIVAPAGWRSRLVRASWSSVASEPWIMTPPVSTHFQLASALFREHGITPAKVVEADDEVVVASLVVAGIGMGLMREDLALQKAAAGAVCLWRQVRLGTTLQFLHHRDREDDPVIRALVAVMRDVWSGEARDAPARPRSTSAAEAAPIPR